MVGFFMQCRGLQVLTLSGYRHIRKKMNVAENAITLFGTGNGVIAMMEYHLCLKREIERQKNTTEKYSLNHVDICCSHRSKINYNCWFLNGSNFLFENIN
jgi:hypothetical protein